MIIARGACIILRKDVLVKCDRSEYDQTGCTILLKEQVGRMKPRSKAESHWKTLGVEYRKVFKQGTGAARAARHFTRLKLSKARRAQDIREIHEQTDESN